MTFRSGPFADWPLAHVPSLYLHKVIVRRDAAPALAGEILAELEDRRRTGRGPLPHPVRKRKASPAVLQAQLLGLERRTARGGRDSIDHGPGGHDDLINAAAGALILAATAPAPREFGFGQFGDGTISTPEELEAAAEAARVANAKQLEASKTWRL